MNTLTHEKMMNFREREREIEKERGRDKVSERWGIEKDRENSYMYIIGKDKVRKCACKTERGREGER
jgi:hypothetical protein